MIPFPKQLFDQKNKRKSFNKDKQYKVPQKHSSYPVTLIFKKLEWWNVKGNSTFIIVLAVLVVTRLQCVLIVMVLLYFFSRCKKFARASICLKFQTLEIQVAQKQRTATKECDLKIFLIKEQKELSQLNEAFFINFFIRANKVLKPNKIQ